MSLDEAEASQPHFSFTRNPGSATTSLKGSLRPNEQAPVAPVEPAPESIKVQLPAREEQVILEGGAVEIEKGDQ